MRKTGTDIFKNSSIFHRMFFAFTAGSILIISVVTFFFYLYIKDTVTQLVAEQVDSTLHDSVSYFENSFHVVIKGDLTLLEATPSLANFLTASHNEKNLIRFDIEKLFYRLEQNHPNLYRSILFIDSQGKEQILLREQKRVKELSSIAQYPPDSIIHQKTASLFRRLHAAGQKSILFEGPVLDANNHQILLVGIAKQEPEIAGFGGVIIMYCDLTGFIAYLSNFTIFNSHPLWLFTTNKDSIIAPPAKEGSIDPRPLFTLNNDRSRIPPGDVTHYRVSSVSTATMHLSALVHSRDLFFGTDRKKIFTIAISIPPMLFSEILEDALFRTFLAIVVALLVALAGSYFLARQFSKPIIGLARTSRHIRQGDFDVQFQSDIGGELGELAESLNKMVNELQLALSARDKEIVERKKAEKQQHLLRRQLVQVQKMEAIGTLAGGIAHDFNNILAIILGNIELTLMDTDAPPSQQRENLQEALKAALRARDLVKQILAFSRSSDANFTPITMQHSLKEIMKMLKATTPSTIELSTNIDINCRPILSDPTQIHQIVMNLCSNAVDAMEEKGKLTVSLAETELTEEDIKGWHNAEPGPYVTLTVEDSGTGIDKTTLDHIFDPFFTTKEVGKGTGMGLSVVHGIVETHRGVIRVESKLGAGSTFYVSLPIATAKMDEIDQDLTTGPTGTERILFVDDEEQLTIMVSQMLGQLGYKVTAKTSSTDALHVFTEHPADFDLVISDQAMPKMSGDELAAKILTIRPDIPIILCSGYSSRVDSVKAENIGIREFCMKPLKKSELAALVRKVLNTKKTLM